MSMIGGSSVKLGKAQKALLLVTALFVTFTLAFFLGRRSVHAQITTERAPEELVRELPEPEPGPAPETVPAPTVKERVELNTAGLSELEALPGIGSVLAERIVAWREEYGAFVSAEQIMDVEGIGEGKYAKIKDLIYVEGEQ